MTHLRDSDAIWKESCSIYIQIKTISFFKFVGQNRRAAILYPYILENKTMTLVYRVYSRSYQFDNPWLCSQGNKCRFWQIFVKALEEFPILIHPIKNQHERSRVFRKQSRQHSAIRIRHVAQQLRDVLNRGLSPVSEAGSYHQLILVSPTVYSL